MDKTIKEIREYSGMNRAEFSRAYDIPIRTLEDWESERRKCPKYICKLLGRAVTEDRTSFKIYQDKELLHELGECYAELLLVLNKRRGRAHDPYPNADTFPTKYFTMVLTRAMSLGIPKELNDRIGQMMNFIDSEDWVASMNCPCPLETRIYFDTGVMTAQNKTL